ncbi:unnamed protein product, partial [Staurois parvus]
KDKIKYRSVVVKYNKSCRTEGSLTCWLLGQVGEKSVYTDYVRCRGGLTIWKLGHCPRAQGQ